jgi:hypothetical protein
VSKLRTEIEAGVAKESRRRPISLFMTRRATTGIDATHPNAVGRKSLYLHIGPSGDAWTGTEIFAAKHLQPDYVRSVLLPIAGCDTLHDAAESVLHEMLQTIERDASLQRQIYDEGTIPPTLLERLQSMRHDETDET